MKKNSLMILMLLLMTACSQKEPEVTPQVKKDVKKDIKKDINATTQVTHARMEIKDASVATTTQSRQVAVEAPQVVQEEFIPEHIRRSHIEVVEHY